MSSSNKEPQSCSKHVKTVIFVAALCTTIILFSLPIALFYVTLLSNNGNSNEAPSNVTNISCSSTDNLWDIANYDEAECGMSTYSGTVCLPYLTEWQECLLEQQTNSPAVLGMAHMSGDTLNQEILQLQDFIRENVSDVNECQDIAIQFLCHYYFPLLNCQSSNGSYKSYSVSVNYCTNITTVCSELLQSAVDAGILSSLPDCSSLPSNITCRDDFVMQDGVCYPRCGEFKNNAPNAIQLVFISEIVAAALIAVVSICTFALSLCNKRSMFRFPSIFLLFFVINSFIVALIILISAMGRKTLFCSSSNLFETLKQPTLFCTISGAIFHYAYVGVIVWWFLHLCVFFYQVMFPFHSDQMRKLGKINKVSIVLTIIGVLVPLPAVITSLALKSNGYNVVVSPPNYCFPLNPSIAFYSIYAPQTILLGIGICFLISIFWRIHLHQTVNAQRSGKIQKLTTAEKKLILASICYAIFGSFSLIFFGIGSGGSERRTMALSDYYNCESNGDSFGVCDRSTFERFVYAPILAMANISLGFIPIGVFNFLLNWSKIEKVVNQQMSKLCKKKSQRKQPGSTKYSLSNRSSSKWIMQGSFDQGSENVTTTTDI